MAANGKSPALVLALKASIVPCVPFIGSWIVATDIARLYLSMYLLVGAEINAGYFIRYRLAGICFLVSMEGVRNEKNQ